MSSHINVAIDARLGSAAFCAEQLYRVFAEYAHNRAAPASLQQESLSQRFQRLLDRWRDETALTSSTTQLISHRDYLAIIGIGERVLPLIFDDLQRGPDHWGPALTAITGANPITGAHAGDVRAIADTWLAWGRIHGYVQ